MINIIFFQITFKKTNETKKVVVEKNLQNLPVGQTEPRRRRLVFQSRIVETAPDAIAKRCKRPSHFEIRLSIFVGNNL